jgi:hypothetical protein
MKAFGERLLNITDMCRDDMHEPDEQGLSARIIGDHLDNACGEDIRAEAQINGFQEFVIILDLKASPRFEQARFNLSTLIALARIGAKTLI